MCVCDFECFLCLNVCKCVYGEERIGGGYERGRRLEEGTGVDSL